MMGGMLLVAELFDAQAVDADEPDLALHEERRGLAGQVDEVRIERAAGGPVVAVARPEEDALHAAPVQVLEIRAIDGVALRKVKEPGGADQVLDRNRIDRESVLLEMERRVDMRAAMGAQLEAGLVHGTGVLA